MIAYFMLVSLIQILVFTRLTNGQENEQDRVDVEVYYETLCPYSRQFMVNQLSPFLKGDLSPQIRLTLIPYGKAENYQMNDSFYEFICHHGEAECYGNKLQACAQTLLNNGLNTPELGFNKKALEFGVCLMKASSSRSSIAEIEAASEKCKVTPEYDIITRCANGQQGSALLAYMGNLTDHLQMPLRNVPTIIFNRVYRKRESDQSESNFKEVFCSKIKSRNHKACQEVAVTSTTTNIP